METTGKERGWSLSGVCDDSLLYDRIMYVTDYYLLSTHSAKHPEMNDIKKHLI